MWIGFRLGPVSVGTSTRRGRRRTSPKQQAGRTAERKAEAAWINAQSNRRRNLAYIGEEAATHDDSWLLRKFGADPATPGLLKPDGSINMKMIDRSNRADLKAILSAREATRRTPKLIEHRRLIDAADERRRAVHEAIWSTGVPLKETAEYLTDRIGLTPSRTERVLASARKNGRSEMLTEGKALTFDGTLFRLEPLNR
jgi:type II secretory pathway component PulK